MTAKLIEIILRLVDEVSAGAKPAGSALVEIAREAGLSGEKLNGLEVSAGQAGGALSNMAGSADASEDVLADLRAELDETGEMLAELEDKCAAAEDGLDDVGDGAGEAGGKLAESARAAAEATQKIQAMQVLRQVFQVLRQGVQLFHASLTRLAESGDKDAQRLLQSLERTGGAWEKTQDSIAKRTIPAVETWSKGVYLILEGHSQEQAAMDETMRRSQDLATQMLLEDRARERQEQLLRGSAQGRSAEATAAQEQAQRLADVERAVESTRQKDVGLLEALTASAGVMNEVAPETEGLADKTRRLADAAAAAAAQTREMQQAQEDFRLTVADAKIAAGELAMKIDEAFSDARNEKVQISQQTFGGLAKDLYNVTQNAIDTGANLPIGQVDGLTERARLLTDALAKMDVDPAVKEAFLAYLDEAQRNLDALRDKAATAASAAAGVGAYRPTGAGGGPQEGTGMEDINRATGGPINEPVVGYGRYSHRRYNVAEEGPEYVGPATGSGGGAAGRPAVIHVHVEVDKREIAYAVAETYELSQGV